MTNLDIGTFLAALARTGAFMHAAPLVGDRMVPPKVRLAASVAIAATIAGARPPVPADQIAMVLPIELLIGAAAGFAARLVVAAAESGGQIIGLQIGLGFASSVDPASGETALSARRLTWCFAALAFLLAGGLESAVIVLAAAPANGVTVLQAFANLMAFSGEMFSAAVRFAAPAIIAGFAVNAVMALASRAAPALNVFSVMLAGVLVVGGVVMMATAPSFAREIAGLGRKASEAMGGVLGQ